MWQIIALLIFLVGLSLNSQVFDRRELQVAFVDQAPVLDGVLDDEVWSAVKAGTGFTQFSPKIGIPMSENTEFKIIYTKKSLFVGVQCFTEDPSRVIARRTTRDRNYGTDDYIYLIIDTFFDRRNAYAFAVNPLGAQWDALINQNATQDENWDGVWLSEAIVDEKGWSVEIEIPFSTVDFDPNQTSWGFNIERGIRYGSEKGRWSKPDPDLKTFQPSEGGTLVGFEKIKPDKNFEFRPYGVLKEEYNRDSREKTVFDVGFDLRYRWTPSLSSTLSVNTDFAQTAIDAPRINFTRFSLFFPEKREFFLEDNAFYTFAKPWDELFIPYYSRRIGLSRNREIVPIEGALKLAGRIKDFQVGFTGVYQDDFGNIGSQPVYVTRISRDIGDKNKLGLIATKGDPTSNGESLTGGVDYQYRTATFLGNKNLEIETFLYATETDPVSGANYSDEAFGFSANYPNEPFSMSVKMLELGEALNPALGFLRRSGVRQYTSSFSYLNRLADQSKFRRFSFVYSNYFFTDLDDKLVTSGHSFYPINFSLASEDYVSIGINKTYDSFDFDWYTGGNILIPAGEYDGTNLDLNIGTSVQRKVSGNLSVSIGDYYNGDRTTVSPYITIHASSFIELYFYYQFSDIDLDTGSLQSHLTTNTIRFKFSPTLNWANTVQYDDITNLVGWNSRVTWEFQPGSRVYFVVNQSYLDENSSFRLMRSQIASKLGMNIRF